MHHYTSPFDPKKGAHLEIFLTKPLSAYSEEDVDRSKHKLNMLIDAGASKTVISSIIAQEIGLVPVGKHNLRSATGEKKTNIYHADLTCPLLTPEIYIPNLEIIEIDIARGWRDGFLGRDFLSKFVFEINGFDRTFTLKQP